MKFKQKFLSGVLALGLLTSGVCIANADTKVQEQNNVAVLNETSTGRWVKENGNWYYTKDAVKQIGWLQVSGNWYYTDNSGIMQTGWKQISNKWYYLKPSGAMATGWLDLNGTWYYLEGSGVMATGWKQLGNNWYYLNNGGAMQKGWNQIGGKWYYMYGSGVMAKNTTIDGWKIDGSGVGTPAGNNNSDNNSGSNISDNSTVYVTASGKSYHSTKDCSTLKRSTKILSMTLKEAKGQGKSDPCNLCVQ